jgi:tripartite ATP-independent transporter DctP family solute receptor
MKQRISILIVILLSAIFLNEVQASGSKDEPRNTENKKVVKMELGMFYDAKSPAGIASHWLSEKIKERTKGDIEIAVYTNNAIGNEREMLLAVKAGDLAMTLAGAMGVGIFTPKYVFFVTPYAMKDVKHFNNIYNSDIGKAFKEEMLKSNNRIMGTFFRGYRNTISEKPIITPDDLKGVKIRMPEMPTYLTVWRGLGATTVPVALPEVYGALQTGIVVATEGPSEMLAANKFQEVTKYFNPTAHICDIGFFHMNEKLFQSLSTEHKKILEMTIMEAMAYADKLTDELDAKFTKQMLDEGLKKVNTDVASFQAKAKPIIEKLFIDEKCPVSYEEVFKYAK